MNDFFSVAARERGGYLLRRDLLDLGLHDRDIRDGMRAGLLVRIRHGTYAPASHGALAPEARHRALAFSVLDRMGSDAVLSHHSASILHTGTTYGIDLSEVHVTKLDSLHGRREAGVRHHVGGVSREDDVVLIDGRAVTAPARAALESASLLPVESGLAQTTFALRRDDVDAEDLVERFEAMTRWPGMGRVRLCIAWAAPDCESVGEVRSLYMFRANGLPMPELQVELYDESGELRGRVDFDWPLYHHCGEFDGLVKYGRLNPYDGELLGEVLVQEKLREDRIRAHPRGMSRWIWSDLRRPEATVRAIRAGLEQSRRLYAHNRAVIS